MNLHFDKPLISFDYAIKYLLKDKGDFEIVEGFLSALLKTQGYNPVKIVNILESESNKEECKSKRSIADVVVQDTNNKKYIIEVERNEKYSFAHKACFNTSRLIVDHLSTSHDYTDIVKVFHVSLLYFPIKNMMMRDESPSAVYHGKTLFHQISSRQKVLNTEFKRFESDALDIFPEYFFISVPTFDDRIDNEIDEWLWVLKHDDIPLKFTSNYMLKIKERLKILNMSKAERTEYYGYVNQLRDDRAELDTAIKKGEEKGREEGREEGRMEGLTEGIEKGRVEGLTEGIEKGRMEGLTEGEAIGMEKGKQEMAQRMKEHGMSSKEIFEITGILV